MLSANSVPGAHCSHKACGDGNRKDYPMRRLTIVFTLCASVLLALSGTAVADTTLTFTGVNGASAPRTPNTTNIYFDGVDGEAMVIALDLRGFAVSTGSACSAG